VIGLLLSLDLGPFDPARSGIGIRLLSECQRERIAVTADVQQLLEVFRRFAVTMTEPFEISHVLYELGDATSDVLGADAAGVSIAGADGRLEFVIATDCTLIELEEIQQAHQVGPCVDAFHRGEPVLITDIAEQSQWGTYREAAAASNFRSVIGMPLMTAEHRLGSLNIYSRRRREWSGADVESATALAEIATAYVVRAGQLASAVDLAGQLQQALDSRVVIEQAKGALSQAHGIPVGEAFELLRSYSRSHNLALRDVAHAVVDDQLDIS
jgi:GAF domain-containing protein